MKTQIRFIIGAWLMLVSVCSAQSTAEKQLVFLGYHHISDTIPTIQRSGPSYNWGVADTLEINVPNDQVWILKENRVAIKAITSYDIGQDNNDGLSGVYLNFFQLQEFSEKSDKDLYFYEYAPTSRRLFGDNTIRIDLQFICKVGSSAHPFSSSYYIATRELIFEKYLIE